ncbi:MAG: hypothetical protein CMM58_04325 [Rhodospirillaceae bacterium]|nr:hypothetical protein [Rhodospirillaceae bacterium]|tara:strand:+ start:688 stop:1257 length:570 start_codon:yes stop_codon:yes gene_type:complete
MGALYSETLNSLNGVLGIAVRRPDISGSFNISVTGFWRSYVAAALVLPANIVVIGSTVFASGDATYSFHEGIRDMLIYGISWLVYPLLVIHILDFLDAGDRALPYLIPYNWASVPTGYFFAFASNIGLVEGVTTAFGTSMLLVAYVLAVFLYFEIARRQLTISRFAALAVVAFDFIFSISLLSILGSVR